MAIDSPDILREPPRIFDHSPEVMVQNANMSDWTQLIAPASALGGVGLTMIGNWALESKKGSNARKAEGRARSASECEEFLAAVESEVNGVNEFAEQHGWMTPGEVYGETTPSIARKHLTTLELYAPLEVHRAAVRLVEKLEAWESTGGDYDAYLGARAAFVERFRRLTT